MVLNRQAYDEKQKIPQVFVSVIIQFKMCIALYSGLKQYPTVKKKSN